MIIRSQNKKELHNLDRIAMIRIITNSQNFFVEVNNQHVIGTYSKEEKAIKVLNRICDFCLRSVGIFQMPQDSEV